MNSKRTLIAIHVLVAVVAFGFPFIVHQSGSVNNAHAGDAPFWSALLASLAVITLTLELKAGNVSSIEVALLGTASGVLAIMRLIDLPNGGNAMFFMVILFGAGFGARFGYYVGALGLLTSALFTGGFGPWLPFQAIGLAWMGAGAGLLAKACGDRMRVLVVSIVGYGIVSGFLYGAVLNLWFWPIYSGTGPLAYQAHGGLTSNLHHYWSFYVATSAVWDAAAAFTNAFLLAILARPMLVSFQRIFHRLQPSVIRVPV